jgi:sRNA-binding protein
LEPDGAFPLIQGECPFGFVDFKKSQGGGPLARTNFQFAKRQKELERKRKMEEKRQRKLDKKGAVAETAPDELQPASGEENRKTPADPAEEKGHP